MEKKEGCYNIVFAVTGTRGDFQPYMSLALSLQKRGHRIKMYSAINHTQVATSFGLDAEFVANDISEGLNDENAMRAMEAGDFLLIAKGKKKEEGEEEKEGKEEKEPKHGKEKDGKEKDGKEKDGKEKEDKEEKGKDARERRRKERDGRPAQKDPRSRNLFGKMLGHLHSAKTRLESEKGWKTTELNQKAQERLQEKLSLNRLNIQEWRKSQFEQQKREEEAKAKEIDKAIEEKELLLLQKRLEAHYSLMMNFIRTKAEPTIFYLPAKHTKDTEQMLKETRAAIKHKIASLKVQFTPMETEEVEVASP
mmetsp:Transcript_58757/g.177601  ORF Transcript_58757/g.177601 Transcript_58757/m.177601 type:complete len:308 (-) Transcript_58757:12-935(-)